MTTLRDRVAAIGRALGTGRERAAAVLLYHRVATPDRDPWALAVSPANFAEQLAVLRSWKCVQPLHSVVELAGQALPRDGAVAITFDDGYADNLHAAAPLLVRHGLPATIFVAAGYVDGIRFWWDELERIVLDPAADMAALGDCAGIRCHPTDPRPPDGLPDGALARQWRGWLPQRPGTPEALYVAIWTRLAGMPTPERDALLASLGEASGVQSTSSDDCRPLRGPELCDLAARDGIEIGAHTVSHPRLAALDPATQRLEIDGSREMLEARLGRPVRSFSYPFGGADDLTAGSTAAVHEAGFDSAWTTRRAVVRAGDAPHELPRISVPDVDGRTFAGLLHTLLPRRRPGIRSWVGQR